MHLAEGRYGRVDDGLRAGKGRDVATVGPGAAAGGRDLVHHRLRGLEPDVVDDDLRALGGEGPRIGPAQAAAGTGDEDGSPFADTHRSHSLSMIVTLACPPPSHIVCRP